MRCTSVISKAILVCAVLFVGFAPARGATDSWNSTSGGLFSTAANWTPGGPPGAADTAVFDLSNTYTVTFISDVTNALCQVENGTVTFALSGATYTLTAGSGMTVGNVPAQTGRLTLTNGTVSGDLTIGTLSGTGSLTISSDAVFNAGSNSIDIGSSNVGTMTVSSGGTYTGTSTVNIGTSSGSNGTLTVTGSGSSFASGTLNVANNGIGDATISSGGTASTTSVNVGNLSGSTGSLTVTGSGSSLNTGGNSVTVGSSGEGHMTISSGGTVTSGFVTIGFQPNSSGDVTITGSGSVWNVSGGLTVASLATGCSLSVISGGTLTSGIGVIGSGSGSSGSVSLSGSGSAWNCTGQLFVGSTGTGNLTVSTGATLTTSNTLTVTTTTGTMTIDNGTVDVGGSFTRNGALNFNDGTLIVRGVYTNGTSGGPLMIDGDSASALPTLELIGNFSNNNITSLTVGSLHQGALVLTSGRGFSTGNNNIVIGASPNASGSITLNPGTLLSSNFGTFCYVGGNAGPGGTGILTIGNAATLSTGTLVNFPGGTVNLNGGTATLNAYTDNGGIFNWTSGQLRFNLNETLSDSLLTRFLGGGHSLVGGQTLGGDTGVTLTLSGPLNVNGGTLTSPLVANSSTLTVNSGAVSSTGTSFTNSAGATTLLQGTGLLTATNVISNNGTLQLASSTAGTGGAGTLTNSGTIRGTGYIGNNLTNNSAGQVQLTTGNRLEFQGGTNTNSGLISLTGGEVVFTGPLTNSASTGLISGRDAIIRTGGAGLTNNGSLAFTAGTMDVYGDITNNVGGLVTVSGGGTATFYDDVTIAAGASNVRATAVGSSVSKVVFFGSYNGGITGGGTAFIEGDHRPGNSPAIVNFGGDVAYGGLSRLFIEIGGTTVGSQFDQVHVTGQLALDGTLNVSLINSFTPVIGNSFDILDWTTLSGTFSTIQLPSLTGAAWDISQLYTTGTLNVLANRGDINRDTHVDIADVSALMTALSDLPTYQGSLTSVQLAEIADLSNDDLVNNKDVQGLIVALANGGGSAPGGGELTAVPEPAAWLLFSIGAILLLPRSRRSRLRSASA